MLLNQVSWVGMLGTTLDHLAQIGPLAISIEVFPRNEGDSTRFSTFHCKRLPPNGEAVGHPWLLFLAWKNKFFCCYCKLFSSGHPLAQHSIPLIFAGTILVPPFWSGRYLASKEIFMRVPILWSIGFNGAVHWSLCWRGLAWRHLFGPRLCNITDFYHYALMHTSKTSRHHWVGSGKSVSNRGPHLLTPVLHP